jgi:mannose/fructose/N-acetylgalactosamine-specific phosphotransferase system component IIC
MKKSPVNISQHAVQMIMIIYLTSITVTQAQLDKSVENSQTKHIREAHTSSAKSW